MLEPMENQSMNLGSSPTQSPYLPGFLLGDKPPVPAYSPGVTRNFYSSQNPNISIDYSGHDGYHSPRILKDRIGTPPVKRLLSDNTQSMCMTNSPILTSSKAKRVSFSSSPVNQNRSMISSPAPPISGLGQEFTANNTPLTDGLNQTSLSISPAQLDPFFTQGDQLMSTDNLDNTWVTVFGFPQSAASYILQQFSHYGTIVKSVISTSGNWMHIKFQSKLQARKALSKNGKVFGNEIMIGVQQCIEKAVMSGTSEHVTSGGTPKSILNQSLDTSKQDTSTAAIRPLTAAYQAARCEHDINSPHKVPQKSSNFVSNALEYVLGW